MDNQSIIVNREWLDKLQADKAALEQRIQQLEGTLSLYGDEDNWECGYDGEWVLTGLAGGPAAAAKALADGEGK